MLDILLSSKLAADRKSPAITTYTTQGCLVYPVQAELSKEKAQGIQGSLLDKLHSTSYLGLVIDLSGIDIIDSVLWKILSNTSVMVSMLGFKTVMTGLSPGVVASIVDVNSDLSKITTAMNIQDALAILTSTENVTKESI
jgi:rsbT antagonist protein RsbS